MTELSCSRSQSLFPGLEVKLLDERFNVALIGVAAGDLYCFAVYDQHKIIHELQEMGYDEEHATLLFDTHYYPLSSHPGGPRFLIAKMEAECQKRHDAQSDTSAINVHLDLDLDLVDSIVLTRF